MAYMSPCGFGPQVVAVHWCGLRVAAVFQVALLVLHCFLETLEGMAVVLLSMAHAITKVSVLCLLAVGSVEDNFSVLVVFICQHLCGMEIRIVEQCPWKNENQKCENFGGTNNSRGSSQNKSVHVFLSMALVLRINDLFGSQVVNYEPFLHYLLCCEPFVKQLSCHEPFV